MQHLIKKVEEIATERYGGHYSIYKFTNHYKGCFGTIEQEKGFSIRDKIHKLPHFKSLDGLLKFLINYEKVKTSSLNELQISLIKKIPISERSLFNILGFMYKYLIYKNKSKYVYSIESLKLTTITGDWESKRLEIQTTSYNQECDNLIEKAAIYATIDLDLFIEINNIL